MAYIMGSKNPWVRMHRRFSVCICRDGSRDLVCGESVNPGWGWGWGAGVNLASNCTLYTWHMLFYACCISQHTGTIIMPVIKLNSKQKTLKLGEWGGYTRKVLRKCCSLEHYHDLTILVKSALNLVIRWPGRRWRSWYWQRNAFYKNIIQGKIRTIIFFSSAFVKAP